MHIIFFSADGITYSFGIFVVELKKPKPVGFGEGSAAVSFIPSILVGITLGKYKVFMKNVNNTNYWSEVILTIGSLISLISFKGIVYNQKFIFDLISYEIIKKFAVKYMNLLRYATIFLVIECTKFLWYLDSIQKIGKFRGNGQSISIFKVTFVLFSLLFLD